MDEAMSPQKWPQRRAWNTDVQWAMTWLHLTMLEAQKEVAKYREPPPELRHLAPGEDTERAGDKLHHVDGTHRSTPPTASGRALELHQAALERHVADGHTHEAPTHVVDTEGRTAEQFLAELFEFERCAECGGDVADHDAIPLMFGEYGGPYFWARCKCDTTEEGS